MNRNNYNLDYTHFPLGKTKKTNTHMNAQNKNAYEIRLEILKMAHDDATGKYYQKLDMHRTNADKSNKEYDPTLVESLFPTSADIITAAEELYKFVENK